MLADIVPTCTDAPYHVSQMTSVWHHATLGCNDVLRWVFCCFYALRRAKPKILFGKLYQRPYEKMVYALLVVWFAGIELDTQG
jgi:hypothetical protein